MIAPPEILERTAEAYRLAASLIYEMHGPAHWIEQNELTTLLHYPSPNQDEELLIELEPDLSSQAVLILASSNSSTSDCRLIYRWKVTLEL